MGFTQASSPPRSAPRKPAAKKNSKKKGVSKTNETLSKAQDVLGRVERIEDHVGRLKDLSRKHEANVAKMTELQKRVDDYERCDEQRLIDQKRASKTVGIIRIHYDYKSIPGDVDSDDSFGFLTRRVMCAGLTFERAQEGYWDEEIAENMLHCVRQLERLGVSGITGDCGFMQWYQAKVGMMTNLPVYLSSLMQCSLLASVYQEDEKVLILTANSVTLTPEALRKLLKICHLEDHSHDRFLIMGCQDVEGFDAVAKGDTVNCEVVQPALVKKVKEVLEKDRSICCLLLECTELPAYADELKKECKRPVFDAVTLINHMHSSGSKSAYY